MKKTRACFIVSTLLLASCSSSTDSPFAANALSSDAGNKSNGGRAGTGGQSSSSGGASGSGGVFGTAGASSGGVSSGGSGGSVPDASVFDASVGTDASANGGGGATSTGGAANTGGAVGTGGSTGAGGSAGAASTGGTSGSGGSAGAGGLNTGGTSGSGGSLGTGGVSSSGGSGNSGGTSGSGGTASGGASGSADASSACSAQTCNLNFFSCCGDACVNFENDPFHCGDCDTKCDAGKMCLGGSCTKPPCVPVPSGGPGPLPPQPVCDPPGTCCSGSCCGVGMLCCEHVGGVAGFLECIDPTTSNGTCPPGNPAAVCASPDTPIATPGGERAIASLRVGEMVYSVDHGKVVAVPLVEVHRSSVSHHHVVHLDLENGVSLEISGPHPTADGRLFRSLHSGDQLGGVLIRTARDVPYTHDYTYDVLPASDSGTYFAGGVLIGSTLGGEASALRPIDFAAISMPTEAGLQSR